MRPPRLSIALLATAALLVAWAPARLAPADVLLSDIVGGGDGTGTAPPGIWGIDADTGIFKDYYENVAVSNTGDNPQIVDDGVSAFIDSTFILDSASVAINSAGLTFSDAEYPGEGFADLDILSHTWTWILKDVTHDVVNGRPEIVFNDQVYEHGMSIHAAAGITFDLDAIREAQGGTKDTMLFSSMVGMDSCPCGHLTLYVVASNDEAILDSWKAEFWPNQGQELEMAIPQEALFLTLATGTAGDGECCDHGVFADPTLSGDDGQSKPFRRGDADASGLVNITDAIFTLNHLFLGGPAPGCPDAADADDDGTLQITDGIFLLNGLFLGGPQPPAPGASDCGPDPGNDDLQCGSYPPCGGP
jgi:hypothetical protein